MENQIEIWKDVKDYEGIYQVSNLGRIKSLGNNKLRKEKILKGSYDTHGYLINGLSKNGKVTTRKVHQLVAIAFLNHKPNGYELVINHKNFIKTDNRVDNLELVTMRENSNKKHIKSTSKYTGVFWCKSSKKWVSKIFINGKRKYLGYFNCEIEAHNTYQNELKTI